MSDELSISGLVHEYLKRYGVSVPSEMSAASSAIMAIVEIAELRAKAAATQEALLISMTTPKKRG